MVANFGLFQLLLCLLELGDIGDCRANLYNISCLIQPSRAFQLSVEGASILPHKLQLAGLLDPAFNDLLTIFDKRFGSNWQKSEQQFWAEFEKTLLVNEPAILPGKKRNP